MPHKVILALIITTILSPPALAENRDYGEIYLSGLARDSWHLNPRGEDNTMVCNVNGPDGFLTIRARPTSSSKANRRLKRLAIVVVDTRQVKGNWVRVLTAHRSHTPAGRSQRHKDLHVTGWAHTGFLCDFLD